MQDKIFLDTNILIYAYSIDEPSKKNIVSKILTSYEYIIISTQTINELINVLTKKKKIPYSQVSLVIEELFQKFIVEIVDESVIKEAVRIAENFQYSYFDSLIVSSAISAGCTKLFTEDMHHEHRIYNTLQIINPFKL